jgi:hypothetical protein
MLRSVLAEVLTGFSVVRDSSPLMSMVPSVGDEGLGEGADRLKSASIPFRRMFSFARRPDQDGERFWPTTKSSSL